MERGDSLARWAGDRATALADDALIAIQDVFANGVPAEAGLVAAGLGLLLLLPSLLRWLDKARRREPTLVEPPTWPPAKPPPPCRPAPPRPALPTKPGLPPPVIGRARIIDGDTVEVGGQRIRLHGIDAPEMDQSGGSAARAHLAKLIAGRPVSTVPIDVDVYGRTVARLVVEGRDLCAAMVADGYAIAYRYFSTAYVKHERAARRRRRGLWARCAFNGIENPGAYRARARSRSPRGPDT